MFVCWNSLFLDALGFSNGYIKLRFARKFVLVFLAAR